MAIFALIFGILRLLLLSFVYGTVLFLVVRWLVGKKRLVRWWIFFLGVFLILTAWVNSYWGDRGFADSERVPIGDGFAIQSIDGFTNAHFSFPAGLAFDGHQEFSIRSYAYDDEFVYGIRGGRGKYFIFSKESGAMQWPLTQAEFQAATAGKELDLQSVKEHWHGYWGTWSIFF